jgi:hypothetical protein
LGKSGRKRRAARPVAARPRVEALETRDLMAAGLNTFAHWAGEISRPGEVDRLMMNFHPRDFQFPRGTAIIGFTTQADGSAFVPGMLRTVNLAPPAFNSVPSLTSLLFPLGNLTRNNPADGSQTTLTPVKFGSVPALVFPGLRSTGAYTVSAYLAGDANGDFQVDSQDLQQITADLGQRRGDAGYTVEADADGDGLVSRLDLMYAMLNAGTRTAIRPLEASLSLDLASDPERNGVVTTETFGLDATVTAGARFQMSQFHP